jgi:hypothetical protein
MSNGTLTNFITCFNNHDEDGVMDKFCLDDTTTTPHAPCVGITDHGPGFIGSVEVRMLFHQLFSTFHNLRWNPVQATWAAQPAAMPSWTGNLGPVTSEVAVQFWLTGQYQNDWFKSGAHASPPLSNLPHNYHGQHLGRKRGDPSGMGLPGVALFSLDSGPEIRQLQIYIDRYALMQSITSGQGDWDAPGGN